MKRELLDNWMDGSDASFDAFFRHAPIFMLDLDADWRIRRASDYWADALGQAPEDVVGHPLTDFMTPESRAKTEGRLLTQFRETLRIEGAQIDFRRAGGTLLPVVMTARGRHRDGQIQRVMSIMYDNSEARATQEALQRAIAEAEEASHAKSRFLAAMGHEIRTPMNAILGFAQLLKMSDLDDRRRTHVDAIQSAGNTLMNLLTDLLDLSQAEAGRLRIDAEAFDLDPFLDQLADWWQAAAADKGLRLRIAKDQGLPSVILSDRSRLQQVLNNYLGNAVKFTESGRITLSVEEVGAAPGHRRIRFEVSDTGPGLCEAQAAQLFKPFVQIGTDASKERGGWGLGLAICHEIAEAMGGEVGVTSTPGHGATFFFEVDVVARDDSRTAHDDAAETSELCATHADVQSRAAGQLTILVAEDNPMSRAMMHDMLTELGHRVTMAEDGLCAVEAAHAQDYDLVFMDVMMPQLDGIGATRRIRGLKSPARKLPIIACSAHVNDQERFRKAGMDAFLPKPVDRRRLEQLISEFHPPRSASDETGAPRQ